MKILIVDDRAEDLYLLEVMLRGSGYETAAATDGAEAMKKLHAGPCDMIISDILMPVMDGFELCREVKTDAKLKHIPFVCYTATYTDDNDEELAMKMGADKFIRKPVEPDRFIKIIKGLIKVVDEGKLRGREPPLGEDKAISKLYSERLVKKLEKKTLDLEREAAERKQAEDALRGSEMRYRTLFKSTTDAIMLLNDKAYFDCNEATLHIFGCKSRDEFLYKHPSELSPSMQPCGSDSMSLANECIATAFKQGKHQFEWMHKRVDGTEFPAEVWLTAMELDGKKVLQATVRDITERTQTREALEKSREQLRIGLIDTVVTVSRAIGARDPYTAGHQQRVSQLSRAIAQEMGLDAERIDGLRMGASIHDIGKIYVPAEILSKPAKLSEMEYKLVQSHAQVGYDILKDIAFPWPVADIAHQHHEHLDGSGYPQGLKSDEICLEARIVGIADVVEAIGSHRPYRPSLGIDAALEEIEAHRGEWFETAAVDACLKLFKEKRFSFEEA